VPSPCTLLMDNTTCANSIGCAWCDPSWEWDPRHGLGACYNPKTESCCTDPNGVYCNERLPFSICDSTEKCASPDEGCEHGGGPLCIPVNSTVCASQSTVTGCLPDAPQCCGDDSFALAWCCAASQQCGPEASGECL
jgi:hypothetical protein